MTRQIPMLPDKALSIRQPWVWAIINAGKRIENRPRRFHYRGPICLHASTAPLPPEEIAYSYCVEDVLAWHRTKPVSTKEAKKEPPSLSDLTPRLCDIQRGGIIGTAEIVDCIEHSNDPWFFGPYGLVLDNVQAVDFIPVKGALGLFDWRKKLEVAG
ncbi:hypothetical protein GCM10007385_35070 [Tateyamaria omphalii]|uniref:hypothetical protein n=1 Tax=Tateyamaria omphalii TaxID=299262 RepID=UPI00167687D4|nr:hypothetical protein [Tateyamaria omphalii]GGX62926.1 hypothetical protein GCM10007385_35070 [Tateyamaria omphalii]